MLRPIDGTHVLLLPNQYFGAGHIRLADLRILGALKAVKQVGTEGAIKVNGEPRNNGRKNKIRVTQAISNAGEEVVTRHQNDHMPRLFTQFRDMLFELLEDFDHIWRPRKRDQLHSRHHGQQHHKTGNRDVGGEMPESEGDAYIQSKKDMPGYFS